ncbi:putative signal peptide protein [Puccinia sorghi]|uniref:Putative signal peptide protein n=1 Tax=Puccinia sorghi TaxID=27349 RepID=A0A0L6VVH8_9BASI|nr:putative signal peptide protein [Puccinia sorghi]
MGLGLCAVILLRLSGRVLTPRPRMGRLGASRAETSKEEKRSSRRNSRSIMTSHQKLPRVCVR